jgi:energy-coupling factor transport system substrate-specific component
MKAAFVMWRNTRMIVLTAVCAAIYGAALIAFKTAIPIIPGFTEVRVGNIFPVPFGLMFGPAGAWGSAIGNLIGDIFGGTFGPGSAPGFVGNFLFAYLPYTLWTSWLPFHQKRREWDPHRPGFWVSYVLICFVSSAACAVVIGAGVDALGLVPYAVLTKIITVNNWVASLIGSLLLITVFNTTKQHLNLFWVDVMEEENIREPILGPIGAWLVALASVGGLAAGFLAGVPMPMAGGLCVLVILVGAAML